MYRSRVFRSTNSFVQNTLLSKAGSVNIEDVIYLKFAWKYSRSVLYSSLNVIDSGYSDCFNVL